MMKKSLLLIIVALLVVPTLSKAQEKWFFSGSVNANIVSVAGESTSSGGLGIGIHRMLGDRFSVGINLSYAGAEGINTLETDVNLAYYGRLADKFYYVPEAQLGVGYFIEPEMAAFAAAISPFGLEFRPTPKLGFRVNILNFSYVDLQGTGIFNFGIDPSMSIICRF